jgi:uncharacterized membrane protein YfcA
MNRDRRFVFVLWAGIVMVPVGVLLADVAPAHTGAALTTLGVVLIVAAVWSRRPRSIADTVPVRPHSAHARAVEHGWIATFVAVVAAFWLDTTRVAPMTGAEAAALIAAVMLLTTGLLRAVYRQRVRTPR